MRKSGIVTRTPSKASCPARAPDSVMVSLVARRLRRGQPNTEGLGPNAPGRDPEGDASRDRSNGPRATSRPVGSSASAIVSALSVITPRSSGGESLEAGATRRQIGGPVRMTNDRHPGTDQIQFVDSDVTAEETAVEDEAHHIGLQKRRFARGGSEPHAAKLDRSREQPVVKTRSVDHQAQLAKRVRSRAFQYSGPNERQVERRVGNQQHARRHRRARGPTAGRASESLAFRQCINSRKLASTMDKPKILTAKELRAIMPRLAGWKLAQNKLSRTFEFQDFVHSLSFVNSLVAYFETVDHHPDVRIAYGEVTFELTRYDMGGKVTDRDVEVAKKISSIYRTRS